MVINVPPLSLLGSGPIGLKLAYQSSKRKKNSSISAKNVQKSSVIVNEANTDEMARRQGHNSAKNKRDQ